MCGIAGLVHSSGTSNEQDRRSLVQQMCDLQEHRGPDDVGVISLGDTCLGAVRLSIIDLSAAGHMPMSDETERWWIVYNGEVYNFQALREELLCCGHSFRSQTDTEVVLHAFMEWGESCLDRFVGMFAFAIYDRRDDRLTLVRDRFGIKPLYYVQRDGSFSFSSELKALIQIGRNHTLDKQGLLEWLLYRNIDILTPETLLEKIVSVLPGQLITVDRGDVSQRIYYTPPVHVERAQFDMYRRMRTESVVDDIDSSIHQAVQDRLMSDVPVGTLCSGGLDSSLITAMAARHRKDVTAFHVSIVGYPGLDERVYAEDIAKRLGVDMIVCEFTGEAFRRELPRAIYHCDFPLRHPNSVAYYLICQIARANGVTVLLSGEGADELFGGYTWRYRRHRQLLRLQWLLGKLPAKFRKGLELAGYASAGLPVNSLRFEEFLPRTVASLDRYSRQEWYRACEEAYDFVPNIADRSVLGAMLGDLSDFLTPLLRRLDRMSMQASTECRVPFLDHRIVEKVINLPLAYRVSRRTDKWVLKQVAARYLPAEFVQRRKMGFPLPLDDYLAPLAHRDLFHQGFCSEILRLPERVLDALIMSWRDNPHTFMSLLSLEIWGRLYVMQEALDDVEEKIEKREYEYARTHHEP